MYRVTYCDTATVVVLLLFIFLFVAPFYSAQYLRTTAGTGVVNNTARTAMAAPFGRFVLYAGSASHIRHRQLHR